MDDEKSKRRRTCADRARKAEMERRRRRGDPATSVFVQMLALLSLGLRALPDVAASPRTSSVLPSPPATPRAPEPSPEPWQRYKIAPSWRTLARDLARPAATADAQRELRSRLPAECAPWLDRIIRDRDWGEIRLAVHVAGSAASDAAVTASMVRAARDWTAARSAARAAAAADLVTDDDGGAASAARPTPSRR